MSKLTKSWILILVGCAVLAPGVHADNEWGLFASYWDPQSTESTFGVGIKMAFGIMPHTRLDLRATYYDKLSYTDGSVEADLTEVPIEGGLQFYGDAGPLELFCGFGLGYYYTEGDVYLTSNRAEDASFDSELGYYANAGFEIPLTTDVAQLGATKVTLYLDVGYRFVELSSVKIGGATFRTDDADLSGVNGNVGLMIHW